MENGSIKYKLIQGFPNIEIFEQLEEIYQIIFDDADISFFKQRLKEKENLLSVIAFDNQEAVGFKIGYHYSKTTFYSWVGGVLKSYRKQGIAKQLAQLQEEWVKVNDFTVLRTKSMNRFKPMMILNLKNGFDIKQVYTNEKGQTKVVFEKELK